MKRKILIFFNDPIFKQGSVIFASSVLANVLNLVFWLYMVRKLSPQDYGTLNTFVSVLMLFCAPVGILQTVITRYTSKFMAHKDIPGIHALLRYFIKLISIFLGIVLAILIIGDHYIVSFLQIDEKRLVYAVAAGIIFSSFATITMGALAGLQRFNDVALNSAVSTVSKLFFGIVLVLIGFRAFGALLGFVFSFLVGFVMTLFQLPKGIVRLKDGPGSVALDKKDIYNYFLPVGLSTVCFFALTNMDIIMVKHFFPSLEAGFYSVAQMVGRIALFVPGAIGIVMFPKVVEHHAKNEDPAPLLKKCLLVVAMLCGIVTLSALIFPSLILQILTGHDQPLAVSLVKFFAVSMSFFSICNILMLYHLSIHRMKFIYIMLLVTLVQFCGICLFHKTLTEVLTVVTACSAMLFYFGIMLSREGARN